MKSQAAVQEPWGGIGLYTCRESREGEEGIGREEPARSQRLRPGEPKARQRCPLFTWNLHTLVQDKPWLVPFVCQFLPGHGTQIFVVV